MKYILIEDEHKVDIAHSEEQALHLARFGWQLVADLSDLEWDQIQMKTWEHANRTGKKCLIPKPLSDHEETVLLARAYRVVFGDECWNALGDLYSRDPEEAKKLGMEALRMKVGGEKNEESNKNNV